MTREGTLVLETIAWLERTSPKYCVPLREVATLALGGNAELAVTTLTDLEQGGFVQATTEQLRSGWLTVKGRDRILDR